MKKSLFFFICRHVFKNTKNGNEETQQKYNLFHYKILAGGVF